MPVPSQGNPGLSPAVSAALQRRGLGVAGGQGALTQVSPQAPVQNPVSQPMSPSSLTQASAPQGTPAPTTPITPKFEPQDRTDLITLALIEQMKNDNKLVKEQTKMAQSPSPAPTPSPVPMGGGSMNFPSGWSQPMATSQMQGDYNYGLGKEYSSINSYGM